MDENFGLKKQLQDGIIHAIQPDIQFWRVNSDEFGPRYVTIVKNRSSVYITGNEGPQNKPHKNGVETSEGADSVAWDGGVRLMAGLSISGLQTSMRC